MIFWGKLFFPKNIMKLILIVPEERWTDDVETEKP